MTRVSLKMLIKLLVTNKLNFVVENSACFESKIVLKFVVAKEYPISPQLYISCGINDGAEIHKDRLDNIGIKTLCYYDTSTDCIIGMCPEVAKLLSLEKERLSNANDKSKQGILS